MTQPGDELLVAYTDGELTTTQRDALARVLENDPVASQRIKSLKGAHQRLHVAFDQMLADYSTLVPSGKLQTPASPALERESLECKTNAGVQERPDRQGVTGDSGSGAGMSIAAPVATAPSQSSGNVFRMVLLLAGLLSAGGIGLAWFYGFLALPAEKRPPPAVRKTEVKTFAPVVDGDWTLAVLHHHTLAVLKKKSLSQKAADMESARVFVQYSLKLEAFHIPDLQQHGLVFTGARVLVHAGERIARLVYTGKDERVVSVYVKAETGPEAIEKQRLGEIKAVHWSHGGAGYVVAGQEPYWSLIVLAVDVKRQNGGTN